MSRVVGADEFLRDLQKLGAEMPRVKHAMLDAGGARMAEGWKNEIQSRDFVDSGAMAANVAHKIRAGKSGPRAEITSLGTDGRGVSNSAKAFLLHYGTSRIPASHWIDRAEETAMPAASEAMGQVLDGALNQTIGG